ncbi:MAG: hypothetical protein WKF67_13850 [Rubrobacteraceae bacterium]
MNMNDFAQEVVLLEDRYPAKLKEVSEYTKDYGEGPVQKLAWVFAVSAAEDAIDPEVEYEVDLTGVYDIAAHTSFATGPNSNFAKLNFPAFVGEDWSGDTDDLIGKSCIVDVTSYETKGGQTRNVIEKIRSPKDKAKSKKKAPASDPIEIVEADFDESAF